MALVLIDWQPDAKKLRTFGIVAMAIQLLLVASTLWRRHLLGFALSEEGVRIATYVLGGGALLAIVLVLARPIWLRVPFLLLSLVTFPIGFVVSYVMLFAMYYCVIVPFGVVLRIVKPDAMARAFTKQPSYWTPRTRKPDPKRYFRQF